MNSALKSNTHFVIDFFSWVRKALEMAPITKLSLASLARKKEKKEAESIEEIAIF